MKIKKILYLLFLFLMPFNITTAQQTYLSNLYNPYQTAGIGYHIIELDSFYLVGALMYDSSLIKSSKEILKFDKSGNLISTINHSPKNISYLPGAPGSFNKAKDGTYIWGGTKRYDSFSKIYGFLMKLDSSLYLVWEKDFMFNNDTTYSYLRITQAKQTFDNGYILTGITEASGQYNFDIFLIKTDCQTW
ncbi:MAG: hypothetical protein K9J13_07995 [Saprospiraceae bacterium]|nr:hypothetical protein [Saprospiraceae bacterium]